MISGEVITDIAVIGGLTILAGIALDRFFDYLIGTK